MQDKSSYTSHHKPQISEGLQNFINAIVEAIVLKGEAFDEQKKKWLKKYSEAEGVNYVELEGNLNGFFEAIFDYNRTKANSILKLLEAQVVACFIDKSFLTKLLSHKSKIILPEEKKIIVPDTQFKTVKIGSQIWMAENLNVDRFRNGDPIPEAQTDEEWQRAGKSNQPAWCYYDNDPSNGEKYGKLYNWYALNDSSMLIQKNWHVPSEKEWIELVEYIGVKNNVGVKLKSTSMWENFEVLDKNFEPTGEKIPMNGLNYYNFNAYPCGYRNNDGCFFDIGKGTSWWSSDEFDKDTALSFSIDNEDDMGNIYGDYTLYENYKDRGFSIRCLKNL
jgi:uncharacterized protein (TIGR02145 family)